MKNAVSLPLAVALPRPVPRARTAAAAAGRFLAGHWLLFAVLAATFGVNAPGLSAYFIGDDFVLFGDIATRSFPGFVKDVVLLRDTTPNWRPLTSVVYFGEYHVFGLNAEGWRLTHLLVHIASVGVLYALAAVLTRRASAAVVAALAFGIGGDHYDTVNYVTAFPHVLATFLLLASLLAMAIAATRRAATRGVAASVLLFGLAVLADEGRFIFAPLLPLLWALYRLRGPRDLPSTVAVGLPFAAIAFAWLAFYLVSDSPQLHFGAYRWDGDALNRLWLYLSWLVWPWGQLPAHADAARAALGVSLLITAAALFLKGPRTARLASAGLVLALLPYIPAGTWTTPRYVYGAAAFFALLLGWATGTVFDLARVRAPAVRGILAPIALVLLAAAGVGWGWQTVRENDVRNSSTEDWRLLAREVQANVRSLPPGSTIYVVGGPWTQPLFQVAWMPSVARTFYGNKVYMFDLDPAAFYRLPVLPPGSPVLLYFNGRLLPVDPRHYPPSTGAAHPRLLQP